MRSRVATSSGPMGTLLRTLMQPSIQQDTQQIMLHKVLRCWKGCERVERRWEGMGDVAGLAGRTLLHADLNPANVLLAEDGTAYVVDWAFAGRGAAFLEMALLVPWLLKAGHSPAEAERWVARFPAWAAADPVDIDLFARVFADKWRANLVGNGADWAVEHAAAAWEWAVYRG
ncbi:phosphotransferase [Actinomadura sp. BRA 177]|nr:phosphotransferase [Actinomadura sp. BRA 177]